MPFHYHRRPSRLLWFFLGGAAFMWYHHAKERKLAEASGSQPRVASCRYGWDWMERDRRLRAPVDHTPPEQQVQPLLPEEKRAMPEVQAQAQVKAQGAWEDEKKKMKQVGVQASEAVADVAELSLDGVLSAVDALRQKLAEHRAMREQSRSQTTSNEEPPHRV